MAGKMGGVVRDISVRVRSGWPELKARLNLKNESNYFNSGFMVIDLDFWRRAKIQEKLVEVSIERFDSLDSQDQDALNIVLEDQVFFLDDSWNTSQYERPALQEIAIHLIGKVKPWHACYKKKFQDKYLEECVYNTFYRFLDRTEYRGCRPWDPAGIGALLENAGDCVPTWDMVLGKVRRVLKRGYRPKVVV
jgi:lipopolysaccharide biosynthesis glycosyltransferase